MKRAGNLFVIGLSIAWAGQVSAEFVLVEDFESYSLGDLATVSGGAWTTVDGTQIVEFDPDGVMSKVGSISEGGPTSAYRAMPTIAGGSTGTLFFRVRTSAADGLANFVFGTSDEAAPSDGWNSYEGYGRITDESTIKPFGVDVRDGGAFAAVGAAPVDAWVNIWLVLKPDVNTAVPGTNTLYYNTGRTDATDPSTVSLSGIFRTSSNPVHGDLITLYVRHNEPGTTGYIDDIYIDTSGENLAFPVPEPVPLSMTSVDRAGSGVVLTWNSIPSRLYALQSTPDIATVEWADLLPFTNLLAVAGSTSVTSPATGAQDYYRVYNFVPPPVFFDDLEGGAPGWSTTTIAGTTDWELGTPNFTSARGVFTNAHSGVNAWATGLASAYATENVTSLRTPEIDLAGLPGAILTFYDVTDLEPTYDFGYVNILTNGVVAETNLYAANGTSTSWVKRQINLNAYTNQQIVIEFKLSADDVDFEADWFGWAVDDIRVEEGPASPPPPPPFTNSVISLVLVDSSGTNNPPPDLAVITEGATLDLDALGVANTNVNIRAEVDGVVGSVTLVLTGATVNSRTESVGPYYQFGDSGGNPFDGTLNAGTHSLVATPWENAGGTGTEGTDLTVKFTVTFTP